MSVPHKPWETNILNRNVNYTINGQARNVLSSNISQLSSQPTGSVRVVVPPPLPPRPPQLTMSVSNRPHFGVAPSMYGGYSGYSGYTGYPSYGNYPGNMYLSGPYGYGSYGQSSVPFENRFLQVAEESSRGAFQSIESLVRAFTSVSMMLESTYHAMYSSFRAILGVVDNFSRLRQMFSQFLSAISILRIIQNFYQRILYWLGVIDYNPQSNQVWDSAMSGEKNNKGPTSSWPLFTFIGLLFGGPYLISKFFSSTSLDTQKWDTKKGTLYKTTYPHEAASESELSFSENEVLTVAPPEYQLQNGGGWLLAVNKQGKVGYVPITRMHVLPKQDVGLNQDNNSNKSTTSCTTTESKKQSSCDVTI